MHNATNVEPRVIRLSYVRWYNKINQLNQAVNNPINRTKAIRVGIEINRITKITDQTILDQIKEAQPTEVTIAKIAEIGTIEMTIETITEITIATTAAIAITATTETTATIAVTETIETEIGTITAQIVQIETIETTTIETTTVEIETIDKIGTKLTFHHQSQGLTGTIRMRIIHTRQTNHRDFLDQERIPEGTNPIIGIRQCQIWHKTNHHHSLETHPRLKTINKTNKRAQPETHGRKVSSIRNSIARNKDKPNTTNIRKTSKGRSERATRSTHRHNKNNHNKTQ